MHPWGGAHHGLGNWAPAPDRGNLDWVPSSWFQPIPNWLVVDNWGENQQMDDFCLSFCLSNTFKVKLRIFPFTAFTKLQDGQCGHNSQSTGFIPRHKEADLFTYLFLQDLNMGSTVKSRLDTYNWDSAEKNFPLVGSLFICPQQWGLEHARARRYLSLPHGQNGAKYLSHHLLLCGMHIS